MKKNIDRRKFVKNSLITGAGLSIAGGFNPLYGQNPGNGKRVGLIGLDTSHVTAVTNSLNNPKEGDDWSGYKVVAAFPTKGSPDMPASIDRLEGFTKRVKELGVEITGSIEELISKVDVIMLESVDGRRHFEEALPVIKSGKKMFIDKPFAASLADGLAIFEAAKKYNAPIFHASSLRYMEGVDEVKAGKIGGIIGADTYGDCYIEPNHPDLFYYCIHGIELLYGIMGTGCKSVVRVHLENTDMVVGTWEDDRIGSYRGNRMGTKDYGATVFGEDGIEIINKSQGYRGLWVNVIDFFETGIPPVDPAETVELLAFMEAGEESKKRGGVPVSVDEMMNRARQALKNYKI